MVVMAGRGPAASKDAARRNLASAFGALEFPDKVGGFALPDDVLPFLPDAQQPDPDDLVRESWHPQTVRWWNAWRDSPQSTLMVTDVDWQYMLDTALLHHQMWQSGGRNSERAAEIRLRVANFAATPSDRARLRVEVRTPDEYSVGSHEFGDGATVTDIRSRRARLSKE